MTTTMTRRIENEAVRLTTSPGGIMRPVKSFMMTTIATAWGPCGMVWREPGEIHTGLPVTAHLCRIITPGQPRAAMIVEMQCRYSGLIERAPNDAKAAMPAWFYELADFLTAFYDPTGGADIADIAVDWPHWQPFLAWDDLRVFQRDVLGIVARIRRGQTMTYGQIANHIGKPHAARAVGAVMRSNPWPVLIPCHRVVGAGGAMVGFSASGGVCAKIRMLEMERSS